MSLITAQIIKAALHRKYGNGNGTAIAFEVAAGTGRNANRHIDAVVMELWPSRGLSLHAIEIKVSKADFKRELADGPKAEEIAQYCDIMSIASPLGLLKITELPSAWGLIEINKDHIFRITKAPVKTKCRVMDRHFMAAMLRSTARAPDLIDHKKQIEEERKKLNDDFNKRVEKTASYMAGDGAKWKEFKNLIGDINWKDDENILNAVRFILRSGADDSYRGIRKIEKDLRDTADRIKEAAINMTLRELPKGKRGF